MIWTFLRLTYSAFLDILRQPICIILLASSVFFVGIMPLLPFFTFGEESKLVTDSVLAFAFLMNLFMVVWAASTTLTCEIQKQTALTVLSKPVGRGVFFLAKYVSIVLILACYFFVFMLASLISVRMSVLEYSVDMAGLIAFAAMLVIPFVGAAVTNFLFRRSFSVDALLLLMGVSVVAFLWVNTVNYKLEWFPFSQGMEWHLVPVMGLVFLAVAVLAAFALACSARCGAIMTTVLTLIVFFLGLVSDYVFGRHHDVVVCSFLHAVIPNWQRFWVADALSAHRAIPIDYVGVTCLYALSFISFFLIIGLLSFEDRELY